MSKKIDISVIQVEKESLEPTFVNYSRVSKLEDNIIIDLGFIHPDEVINLQKEYPEGDIPEDERRIRAKLLARIAMSIGTFLKLSNNVGEIVKVVEKDVKKAGDS